MKVVLTVLLIGIFTVVYAPMYLMVEAAFEQTK